MKNLKASQFKNLYLDVYECQDFGNTYFLSELFIRDNKGNYDILKQFPLQYGYESAAEYTAKNWLVENCGVDEKLPMWQVIKSNNVKRSTGHKFSKLNKGDKSK